MKLSAISLSLLPTVLAAPQACQTNTIISNVISNTSVPINNSPTLPFQSPALTSINSTAWEYWYFDGVSDSARAGITITFFRDPFLASVGLGTLRVSVDAVWENGTTFGSIIPMGESVVETCGDVTKGSWTGPLGNATFEFRGGNKFAKIDIAATSVTQDAISGSFTLRSFSRPHYPAGENYPNARASIFMAPLISWNEGIPAGDVTTGFVLKGTPLEFKGIGGTDRNFAPYIWDFVSDHWWWIRSVTGPYTFVYWKFVSGIDKKPYSWSYLEKSGIPIFTSGKECSDSVKHDCAVFGLKYDGTIKGTYNDSSTGFDVEFHGKGKSWKFDIEHENVVFEAGAASNSEYSRFVNSASGGEVGRKQFEGVSKSEQNKIRVIYPIL